MESSSAETFANRGEPIPVLTISGSDEDQSLLDPQRSKRRNLKDALSGKSSNSSSGDVSGDAKEETGPSLQDRLFARLLKQVIPSEDMDPSVGGADNGSSRDLSRPSFSLPLMTSNFRRFNARVGIVFVIQNRMIRLLSWRIPTHTLSFLAIYSFTCLDPYLLFVLPVVAVLLAIMVPSFIVRHPPPPTNVLIDPYSAVGPAVAPARHVKPVSEMSKDFFRNLRDLQNCMQDFAEIHDRVIRIVTPPTNFSDEPLSSALFLVLAAVACFLFVASHLLPWRAIFLVVGWAATCFGHPAVQRTVQAVHEDHLEPRERQAKGWLTAWIENDILLDSAAEKREVEVFELQRCNSAGEWEGWVFSPSPYDPLSAERTSGNRPAGTRFFEDVQPPAGWQWSDKKWTLDLLSREWVEERMITGVEIETEGQRWVYDIQYDSENEDGDESRKDRAKSKKRDWEGGSGVGKRGEWRRRRWARIVQRRVVGKAQTGKG